jgi:hypothetical protein
MDKLHSPRVLLLFSYILGAQCGHVVPVFNSIEGDQGYSYPNPVTEILQNSSTIISEAENAKLVGEHGIPDTKDRSQATNGSYWLGNSGLHKSSQVCDCFNSYHSVKEMRF